VVNKNTFDLLDGINNETQISTNISFDELMNREKQKKKNEFDFVI